MATMPPPFSPRDARRQAKDAFRAQRAAYRAQSQWSMRRQPSFVGPLVLISVGVVALLLETGHLRPETFWGWYVHWWPLLLILIGLALLAEHILDRRNPLAGRRSIGGIIWLIVLLALAGGASHKLLLTGPWSQAFSDNFGDHQNWLAMMGEEHENDVSLAEPIGADGSLTIDNAHGAVEVSSITVAPGAAGKAGAGEVKVEAHQVVHANSNDTAQRNFASTRPQLVAHGADATLTVPAKDGANVDLKITVPAGIALVLRTTHGDVQVSGLRRNADLNVTRGDVTVDSMGGSVHVVMDHGDVIAHEIEGDLSIDGRADDVSVSGVKGRSSLNGDFFGDTKLDSIGGPVHFHSSRTDLDVPKLGGEMTIDSGDLRLVNPSGGIRVATRSKDIEITGLVGDAHVEDNNGDVNATAGLPLGNLELSAHTGSLTVTVPSNASFSVHASAKDSDEVQTDFALSSENSSGRRTVNGQVGQGGPHLELMTDHGDLTVHRGGIHIPQIVVPEIHTPELHMKRMVIPPIDVPVPPGVPGVPAPPRRHLHARDGEPPQAPPTVQ